MATNYTSRLVVIVPVGSVAAVGTWWQANIDANDDLTTWPTLSATGSNPATHRWCSVALTDAQLRAVLVKVCQLANVTPPSVGTWNGWTRAQKRAWLASTRDSLYANTGIWLDVSDNDGDWDDSQAERTGKGLQVIQ